MKSNVGLKIMTEPLLLPGTKTLLMGPAGTGKTTSLASFIKAGIELVVITTEPGGEESLIDAISDQGLPFDKFFWKYVSPASPSFDTLLDMATKVNLMSYEDLSKIKAGVRKSDYTQFIELIKVLRNFVDDRTGKELGAADTWGPDRVLVIDSLSGMNDMALDLMVGAKPLAHKGEYGVAMNMEEKLILKLCGDLKCFFVLCAHVEREMNEATGTPMITVGALGSKLGPKLPKRFSDVVLAVKQGTSFSWSTSAMNVDLKHRALPLKDNIEPDFGQIVKVWRERNKAAQQTDEQSEQSSPSLTRENSKELSQNG